MSKKIEFRIPVPCHENWHNMQSVDQGKFCMACSKTVVDFSQMSNREILLHISKSSGNVCGRFTQDQLGRGVDIEGPVKKPSLKYAWNMLLAVFLTNSVASAQTKPLQGKIKVVTKPVQAESRNDLMGDVAILDRNIVNGNVVDADDNKPIAFATVTIKPKNLVLLADSNGRFEFTIKEAAQSLEISAVGYESKIVPFETENNKEQSYVFYLKKNPEELGLITVIAYPPITCGRLLSGIMGAVVSVPSQTIIETIKDTITAIFSDDNIRVYPNPVLSGSIMHIKFDLKNMDKYELLIMNSAGQILKAETFDVQMKNQVKQIFIPATFAKGIYFLRIQRRGKKDVFSKKFMVK